MFITTAVGRLGAFASFSIIGGFFFAFVTNKVGPFEATPERKLRLDVHFSLIVSFCLPLVAKAARIARVLFYLTIPKKSWAHTTATERRGARIFNAFDMKINGTDAEKFDTRQF